MLSEYSRVKVITNRLAGEGIREGMLGYVIEEHGDGNYEVEFSDPATGNTLAQLVLSEDEMVAAPE